MQVDVLCIDREMRANNLGSVYLFLAVGGSFVDDGRAWYMGWLPFALWGAFCIATVVFSPRRKLGVQTLWFEADMVKIGESDSFTRHELSAWRTTRSGAICVQIRGVDFVLTPRERHLPQLIEQMRSFARRPEGRPKFRILWVSGMVFLIGGAMLFGGAAALPSERVMVAAAISMALGILLAWLVRRAAPQRAR